MEQQRQISKEAILENAHPDKSYLTPPTANYATVYKAMDEYAKQQAIAFGEWASSNDYIYLRNGEWMHRFRPTKYTTDQLYELFIKENQK